jgi:hypothetical protein
MVTTDDATEERTSAKAERTARKTKETQKNRNLSRLKAADDRDTQILGEFVGGDNQRGSAGEKTESATTETESNRDHEASPRRNEHLEPDPAQYFPQPARGPDDEFETPTWFLDALRTLARTETKTPSRSPIVFQNSMEAAQTNGRIFESMNFDIGRLITE